MKKTLLVITVIIFCIISQNLNAQVTQDWVFRDSINSKYYTSYHYMKTDINGNNYLATTFDSSGSPGANRTIWLIEKINSQGSVVWRNTIIFPINGEQSPISSIFLDLSGNLFVLGRMASTINTLKKPLIVKYNSAGVFEWRELIDSSSTVNYYPFDNLTFDNSGNIYFASQVSSYGNFVTKLNNQGKFIRNINCGLNSSGESHLLTDSLDNIFWFSDYSYSTPRNLWIRKFDSTGVSLKNKHYFSLGTSSFNPVSRVKFDKNNNILLSFGQADPPNAFIVKLNTECDTLWTKMLPNSWYGTTFDIDDSSNVYFKLDKTGTNYYKYNSAGQLIWSKSTFLTDPPKLLVDKSGNSYVADSLLYKYDLNGNEKYHFLMNSALGLTIHENISGIDSSNNLYVSGTFRKAPQANYTQIVLNKYKQLLPVAPTLLIPINNSYSVSLTPVLDWNDVSVINYKIQISTNSGFTAMVLDTNIGNTSQITVPANKLSYNTQYYWRVSATNEIGTGPWSSTWNFTTILQAPTLISPTNGASSVTLTPLIDWSDVTGATTYNVQVANNSGFNSPVIDLSSLPTSQYQVPSGILQANTLYYWRASASNSNGTSSWTTAWNFTTLASPNTPNLISPTNGSNILTLTPTLDWNDVSGALSYTVQVSTDTNFINLTVNQSGLTASQYSVTSGALTGNTTYYWRARALNEAGQGPWSVRWNFRVVTIPPAPNLLAPLNNSTNQPPTVLLDWDSLASANTYRIQLATDSLFNSVVYDTSGVTRSYVQMRPGILLANVKYYWRINATNLAGTGSWSAVWNFRVNPTGIYQFSSEIPKEFKLYNNYPNPFNPSTKIRFDIPKNSNVRITIYEISGRQIENLINENLSAGSYELTWIAYNLSSGVYFYRIESENFTNVKRMLLVK